MSATPQEVLKRPMLTEKGSRLLEEHNQYTFEVAGWANKLDVRRAVEGLFRVKVLRVNLAVMPGKPARLGRFFGRKPAWKRALVTLKEGDRIEIFEKI